MRFYDIEFNLNTSTKADLLNDMAIKSGSNQYFSSKGAINNNLHFVLDETNPYAIRITFNIQHFSDAGVYTPSVLTMYNPPTSFFSCAGALVGSTVKISAGIKPSVFTSKLNLSTDVNTLLYIGNVARVVPQYTGKDPSVAILLGSFIDSNNTEQVEPLEKGGSISEYLQKILNKLYPSVSVEIAENAKDKTLQDKQTYQNKFSKLDEVSALANKFGLRLAIMANKIKIYDMENPKDDSIEPFKPKEQDFLTQPELQSLSEIQCVFALNASLQLGQDIELPSGMAMNGGSLLEDSNALAGVSNLNALITSGTYTIKGIWHTGDSRNSSAEAWATTISAVKATNNLAS